MIEDRKAINGETPWDAEINEEKGCSVEADGFRLSPVRNTAKSIVGNEALLDSGYGWSSNQHITSYFPHFAGIKLKLLTD